MENRENQRAVDPSPKALPSNLDLWLIRGYVVLGGMCLRMSLFERQCMVIGCDLNQCESLLEFYWFAYLAKNIYLIRVFLRI